MTLEADIEKEFVLYAAAKGCHAIKLRIDGQNGWPDRTVITPSGVLFMEFKTSAGKVRPMQSVWAKLLSSVGHQVHFPRSFQAAKEILDGVL